MSFTAALCYDFEVHSEAQERWLEIEKVKDECRGVCGKTPDKRP